MVNVSKLEQYMEKRGYTWESLNKEIGGLPATIEEFASSFEDEATADVITSISGYLRIPSHAIGMVFFAPAWYDDLGKPHLDDLSDYGDYLIDLFDQLELKQQHKLWGAAIALTKD